MATKSKPKDLRLLMKEQLNKSKRKINSPLARYNNAGQLFCVLCNSALKSDLFWDAHIRGAKHKENLIALKSGQPKSQQSMTKHPSNMQQDKQQNSHEVGSTIRMTSQSISKRKSEQSLNSSSEVSAPKKLKASNPTANSSIPHDFFDEGVGSSIQEQKMLMDSDADVSPVVPLTAVSDQAALPSDFFDDSKTEEERLENVHSATEKQSGKSESIPEGFFDDPKLDAKARKVEYKDPQEEEWEKFQKALSTENQVSEAIIHEEEEESRIDRALDEISEQRLYYIRADALRDKQSAFKQNREEKRSQSETSEMKEESNSDSDDMEELFNWRAKKAL